MCLFEVVSCFLECIKGRFWNLKNQGYIVYVAYGTVNVIILPWLGWVKLLHLKCSPLETLSFFLGLGGKTSSLEIFTLGEVIILPLAWLGKLLPPGATLKNTIYS